MGRSTTDMDEDLFEAKVEVLDHIDKANDYDLEHLIQHNHADLECVDGYKVGVEFLGGSFDVSVLTCYAIHVALRQWK